MRFPLPFLALWLFAAPHAPGDEAILLDGRKLRGSLSSHEARWVFRPGDGKAAIPLTSLAQVRFRSGVASPPHVSLPVRAILSDGSELTGGLVELNGKVLILRTAWAERLVVPRKILAALRQPPGWRIVAGDGFANWKAEGKPILDKTTATLSVPGQSLTLALDSPLEEGRADLTFDDSETVTRPRGMVEMEFRAPKQTRRLVLSLKDGEPYQVRAEGLEGESTPVARSGGRQRLVVQFSRQALRVMVNNLVVWHSLKQGAGGPLVRLRIACAPGPSKRTEGRLRFSEFSLHRAVAEGRHPAGDPTQDEVWQTSGDQLFGRLLSAGRDGIRLEGRFGTRTLGWSKAHGVYPRDVPRPAPLRDTVKLTFDNGFDSVPDVLIGLSATLTKSHLSLKQRDLGEISLERSRLRRLDRE
jgi:hypothetical protein